MGRRSRKRSISEEPPAATPSPRRASSAERDAAARAELTELQPGEHPLPLKIAVAIATVVAVSNIALYVGGVKVNGRPPPLSSAVFFPVLMFVCAWGMWTHRYWAVLGFQALLAITILAFALLLLIASNVWAVLLCVTVLLLGGWLFWKLVRVLGRMKVPRLGE